MELLYFTASWCGPCRMFKPIMADVGKLVTVKVLDVDEYPELAEAYNVKSVPTVVKLEDGVETKRILGAMGKSDVIAKLEI